MTRQTLLQSARRIVPLAWPMYIGQIAVLAFSTVDTLMVARHSALDLAALAVGGAAYISVFIGLMGVVMALGPIAGQRWTSSNVRPQPLQTSSPWLVEQIAMHGASGVVAYQASQASRAAGGIVATPHSSSW